ncbi:MAG: GIY-YIG nuclease family protein [Crocinitomicaceae bacterium]|nr:GIY-YIG nuclease family protein [Crocinitomicaceae bacterium]
MPGFMYILECNDGTFYTGSTIDLDRRIKEHNTGQGANYTAKRIPVSLIYYEEYWSVKDAFIREKQVQKWSRKKKLALINNELQELNPLASCKNDSTSKRFYNWDHLRGDEKS